MSELIGLGGASLAGYAYLPQITHLIRERCSAGISRRAFGLWLLASILITIHAVLLPAPVFILLGAVQIAAISTILMYSARYRGLVCPVHALSPARDSLSLRKLGERPHTHRARLGRP
jgi:uncharacterized protein with PQ loop repeat